jgi:hypothetical protein
MPYLHGRKYLEIGDINLTHGAIFIAGVMNVEAQWLVNPREQAVYTKQQD